MSVNNPFLSTKTSEIYKNTDFLYLQSSKNAVEIANPKNFTSKDSKEDLVIDLGAGTGISSHIILNELADNQKLIVLEPSKPMIDKACQRLQHDVEYINDSINNLAQYFDKNLSLAYALSSFHLFGNLTDLAVQLKLSMKPGAHFIFNLAMPSITFSEISLLERNIIKANYSFYLKLYERTKEELILNTSSAFEKILNDNYTHAYNKENLIEFFQSIKFKLHKYQEAFVEGEDENQKAIWRMIAASYIEDEQDIEDLISEVELPDKLYIRQAFFDFEVN